jgi:hypothetical protein
MRWILPLVVLIAMVAAGSAEAASKHCAPVRNPYPGTKYEGVDLSHIRALNMSCRTARHVARKGHRKALAVGISQGPIVHVTWHGWHVTGDLHPASDRFTATKGTRRVRWRF